jgi:streptogramin lyase
MSVDRSFIEANRRSLDRMRTFVEAATDDDLRTEMPAGWTVAAVLGHLAFWDQRVQVVLDMVEEGVKPPPYDEGSVDWINDTAKRFLLAMEPRALARLALDIATRTDERVAHLSDEVLDEATQLWFTERRCDDRNEHLDEVEQALAGKSNR